MMVHRCRRVASLMGWFFITMSTIVIIGIRYSDHINLSLIYSSTNMKISKVKPIYSINQLTHKDLQKGSSNDSFRSVNNNSSRPTTDVTSRPTMNMFLDGLLAYEELDPSSCLSKYESHKYRKPSPYKSSLYLTSKLRKYEDLHKLCGPQSVYYKEAMKKLQTKSYKTNYDETINVGEICNYIVWKAFGGLGNRILSITSAFLYALLTNRVLLVEFHTSSMVGIFCEPFPNSSWLLSTDFPIPAHGYDNDTYQTFESFLHVNNQTVDSSSKSLSPLFVHLNLRSWSPRPNSLSYNINNFQCDHSHEFLRLIPTLIIESDYYFIPSIFMIPSFQEELSKLFPNKNIVFHLLGNYLFNPSNRAWEIITKFYESNLSHAKEKVGLQIRLFDTLHITHKNYMRQILSCTSSHNLLPEIETKVTTKNSSLENKNQISSYTAILVVSLYSYYAENLTSMYSMSPDNDSRVTVHQPSHEELQNSNDNQHNMKAWVDMYLLSLCEVMVTSAQSTFGYVAQSLGGSKPWILTKPIEEGILVPPCRRALSMEPCMHLIPEYVCKTSTKRRNITLTCEDISWGVKLNPNYMHDVDM